MVLIDMGKPLSCEGCRFCEYEQGHCTALPIGEWRQITDISECPLKEMAERKTGKWIPAKERLPEKNGTYLVYVRDESYCDKTNDYMSFVYFSRFTGEFTTPSKWYKVLAWMPCPEPYKEVEE